MHLLQIYIHALYFYFYFNFFYNFCFRGEAELRFPSSNSELSFECLTSGSEMLLNARWKLSLLPSLSVSALTAARETRESDILPSVYYGVPNFVLKENITLNLE